MLIIRPILNDDFDDLLRMAKDSGHGFTSLPVNPKLLRARIESSCKVLKQTLNKPSQDGYLFVLYDTVAKKVVGVSGIESAVGLNDPFYHYHLSTVVHSSKELKVYNTAQLLTLCNDYTGLSEICTLFLDPEYRQGFNGRILSKFRFLFMAEHSERFSERVFAEMRGLSNEQGISPFWLWLEENFFSVDFPTADYLSGIGHKQFIAELMPKYPIYVNLLSEEAQNAIGQTHQQTLPALKLLEKEGFSWRGYIDIFDAGPTVEAKLSDIVSVKMSRKVSVHIEQNSQDRPLLANLLIINCKLLDFRAGLVAGIIDEVSQSIKIDADVAANLLLDEGDSARVHILT